MILLAKISHFLIIQYEQVFRLPILFTPHLLPKWAYQCFSLLVSMLLIGLFIPPFKKAWTAPFALLTAGVVFCLLALLTWVIDVKKHNKWCEFFRIYGSNAIVSFFVMDVVWVLFVNLKWTDFVLNIFNVVFFNFEEVSTIATTVIFILLLWVLLYFLDKKKIYIRL